MLGGPNSDAAVGHQKCWYIQNGIILLFVYREVLLSIDYGIFSFGKDSFTEDASLYFNDLF